MGRKKSWWFKGQSERVREDRGGRIMTLLCAISVFGVELFMFIEGSVDSPTWCYFISEI
jgi:hypothetical protein